MLNVNDNTHNIEVINWVRCVGDGINDKCLGNNNNKNFKECVIKALSLRERDESRRREVIIFL